MDFDLYTLDLSDSLNLKRQACGTLSNARLEIEHFAQEKPIPLEPLKRCLNFEGTLKHKKWILYHILEVIFDIFGTFFLVLGSPERATLRSF